MPAPTRSPGQVTFEPKRIPPLKVWGAVGALILAFDIYLIIQWVIGPDLARVPSGPDTPPEWMRIAVLTAQVVGPLGAAIFLYRFLIRPWRSDRHVTLEGLVCLAGLTVSIYDPASAYVGNWVQYNSYFVNFGAPIYGLPGWLSFHEPGASIAWPILFVPPIYVWGLLGFMLVISGLMRKIRSRWPSISTPALLVVTWVCGFALEYVFEGIVLLRLGFYVETGWSLSAGKYYQLPVSNMLLATNLWVALGAFHFFRNDRGQAMVERGVEQISTPGRAVVLRGLAVVAALHAIFLCTYHIPQMLWQSSRAGPWPKSMQSKSYFMGNLCGPRTDRACPAPGVPLHVKGSAYLDPAGNLVVPPGTELPRPLSPD